MIEERFATVLIEGVITQDLKKLRNVPRTRQLEIEVSLEGILVTSGK